MRAAFKGLPPLILASASPRRVELLRQLTLDFKVVPGDVVEIHHGQMTARELSQVNAYRKAAPSPRSFPMRWCWRATPWSTWRRHCSASRPRWKRRLDVERLQGRTHQVVTGICLLHLRNHRQAVFAESTAVTFRPLDDVQIRRYLK